MSSIAPMVLRDHKAGKRSVRQPLLSIHFSDVLSNCSPSGNRNKERGVGKPKRAQMPSILPVGLSKFIASTWY